MGRIHDGPTRARPRGFRRPLLGVSIVARRPPVPDCPGRHGTTNADTTAEAALRNDPAVASGDVREERRARGAERERMKYSGLLLYRVSQHRGFENVLR